LIVANSEAGADYRLHEVEEVIGEALPGEVVRDVLRLTGGSKKGVYRVTLDDFSTAVVYRWHRDENYWPDAGSADTELALGDASGLHLFLASHAELHRAGVRVPRVLCASDGSEAHDGWAVIEDVSGGTLETTLAQTSPVGNRATRQLARQVEGMHAVVGERPGKVRHVRDGGGSSVASHLEVFERAQRDLAEASHRIDAIDSEQSKISDTLADRVSEIRPRARFSLIHGELGPDHVLLAADGEPVVIDIEGAMFFDVEWEHAFVELRFGGNYRHFASDDLDSERLRLYRLCMYLSLVAGPLRLLDGDFPHREAMQRIIDANVGRVLVDVGLR